MGVFSGAIEILHSSYEKKQQEKNMSSLGTSDHEAARVYPVGRYNTMVTAMVDKLFDLANTKGAEYAHGNDRLDNFRRNGEECGVPMEVCWRIYAGKHWDAITTYIRDIQTGTQRVRSEPIEGRVLDLIVYLTLLLAIIDERQGGLNVLTETPET